MKKKLSFLMALALMFTIFGSEVKAAETCDTHVNYYFFLEPNTYDSGSIKTYYTDVSKTSWERPHGSYFINNIPTDAKNITKGVVKIKKDSTSQTTEEWGITNFYNTMKKGNSNEILNDDTNDKIHYLIHERQYSSGNDYTLSTNYSDIKSASTADLVNATIFNATTTSGTTATDVNVNANPSTNKALEGNVTRSTPLDSVNALLESKVELPTSNPNVAAGDNFFLLEPALYYIQYQVCTTTIDDPTPSTDIDKTNEDIQSNVQTGSFWIYVVWGIGAAALIYTVYYYASNYKKSKI